MAEGKIIRKGGAVTAQALAPTITEVSTDVGEIVFTITNNDTESAVILYETNDTVPDKNSIELAGGATSSNLTISSLTVSPAILYASANVVGKVKSNITERSFTFAVPVYTAATGGTTAEYDDGGKRYKSHTFNSSGTFTVTTVGDAIDDRNKVDYLIIAGGGGGGRTIGGGGGAGGYQTTIAPAPNNDVKLKVTVTTQAYTVTVGLGGAGATQGNPGNVPGVNGQNTSALGVTSNGGGGGGSELAPGGGAGPGIAGGSGGGGASFNSAPGGSGIFGQGFAGGAAAPSGSGGRSGGGGGGASAAGSNGLNANGGGNAGNGLSNSLRTGSNETRGGGGGGGLYARSGGIGGTGGGGNGNTNVGFSGAANTGGGAGGGGFTGAHHSGGNGGSGIVVIRYEIAPSV